MIKRTLYFGNPSYLSLQNDQLVLKYPEVEKNDTLPDTFKQQNATTIPIEDVGVVILDHKQITITQALLKKLLENNCAVITCDSRRMPSGLFLPLEVNSLQEERFDIQINASLPLKKQLWQQTVIRKIENQAAVLQSHTGQDAGRLSMLARNVKSGDVTNMEAVAASYYWTHLFPDLPNFTRNRDGDYPNNLLNYGYAILRALVARALVASGLLPTFGIHHRNRYNAYCLADDIMEPYRPYVDAYVIKLMRDFPEEKELSKSIKSALLQLPVCDVTIQEHRSPLMVAVGTTAASLFKCYSGQSKKIAYPKI
ncbi:MAG: type II CRISPR-associated endonuclease Cas1 [Bacteroidales bacterium]|nr:type II CRISPR-associated endonuclease Cas1 [Bacteroidales bacterium]